MKKRSRVLSVLLTATMVVGVAGCGSSDAASDNAGSSAQETVGESTEAADEAEREEVGQYTVLTDESGNPYDLGGMESLLLTGSVQERKRKLPVHMMRHIRNTWIGFRKHTILQLNSRQLPHGEIHRKIM